MSNNKLDEIIDNIESLTYEDKSKLYTKCFGFGTLASTKLNDKLILISLVALTANKLKQKNPELTTLELLEKITGGKDSIYFHEALENLALIVDDLSFGIDEFDPCGLTNSKDIINNIKELLETWLPF